jgi:hypothetical protein
MAKIAGGLLAFIFITIIGLFVEKYMSSIFWAYIIGYVVGLIVGSIIEAVGGD